LYADECVDARIIDGLRRRGIHVTTAADQGLLGATDQTHLAQVGKLSLVLLTADHDFLELVSDGNTEHPGILFIQPRTAVGAAVRALALAVEVLDSDELTNWIEWIP